MKLSEQANQATNLDCFHNVEGISENDAVCREISFKLEVYMTENALLKRIMTEMERKYDILNKNCQLLREKIVNE